MKNILVLVVSYILGRSVLGEPTCSYNTNISYDFEGSSSQATRLFLEPTLADIPVVFERTNGELLRIIIDSNTEIPDFSVEQVGKEIYVNISQYIEKSFRNDELKFRSNAAGLRPTRLLSALAISQLCDGACRYLGLSIYALSHLTANAGIPEGSQCPPAQVRVLLPKYRCEAGEAGNHIIRACEIEPELLLQAGELLTLDFVTPYGERFSSSLVRKASFTAEGAEILLMNTSNHSVFSMTNGSSATYSNEYGTVTMDATGDTGSGILHIDSKIMRIQITEGKILVSRFKLLDWIMPYELSSCRSYTRITWSSTKRLCPHKQGEVFQLHQCQNR